MRLINTDMALDPATMMAWLYEDWDGAPADSHAAMPYTHVAPGVALIRAAGPIAPIGMLSLTYDALERAVSAAVEDLSTGALVVQLETPGGMTAGLLNSMQRMGRIVARRGVPVYVHTQGMCLSAGSFLAHALAGAGGLITVEPTGCCGQAGVYRVLAFRKAALEQAGVDVRYVSAGRHKIDLFPELEPDGEAMARAQGQIDRVYETLCRAAAVGMAARRGISPDDAFALIRGQESKTYYGEQEAIDAGACDAVALLDDVIAMAARAAA